MQHLGDITKINGAIVPAVDCVIGGSPCQDLSIAGKRAGLAGERSALFIEQIRIVKEMREHDRSNGRADEFLRPRYMVWENVPGAFSSNKGRDFAAVIEEIIKIVEPEAPAVYVPDKGWPTRGSFRDVDGRWSVAWRTLDAQYWGVPQRRRRISLVADFGGDTAPEILFVRKGLSGNTQESRAEGKSSAGDAESSASYAVRIRGGRDGGGKGALVQTEKSGTIGTHNGQSVFCLQGNVIDRADTAGCNGKGWRENVSYTLNTVDRPAVCAEFKLGNSENARSSGNQIPQLYQMQGFGDYRNGAVASSLKQRDHKDATDLIVAAAVDCRNGTENADINGTLQAKSSGGTSINLNNVVRERGIVRRLTPLECERLQGFPDGWTDIGEWTDSKGKLHRESSDSIRYKALGNSIALPPWKWVLKRLCANFERDATMASLFDGIGGFPLIWEQLNGKGSCLWASEIEEFPIAVTKLRFGNVGGLSI